MAIMFANLMIPISWSSISYIHTTSSNDFRDYYEKLGVSRQANAKEIKAAYYDKAKTYHPDTNKSSSGATRFQEISEAYEILGDATKRRAYDKTTGAQANFGQHLHRNQQYRNDTTSAFRATSPNEPLNMSHIHQVYKTINREENEKPKFRPFEDHCYPGTDFNRFEYSRQWNYEKRAWAYSKRSDIRDYHRAMNRSSRIVRACLAIITVGSIVGLVNYRFLPQRLSNRASRSSDCLSRDGAGMYILRDEDRP